MLTSYLVIAESGLAWTPETFYIAAAVVHLVVVLLVFRLLALPPDYNTFVNALFVAVPTNAVAYFTKDLGLVGVLLAGVTLFAMLAAISRGDVMKSLAVWVVAVGSYWGMAYFIVPIMAEEAFDDARTADEEFIAQQLGSIPQALLQGGLEVEPMTEDDYKRLRGEEGEEDK